MIESNIITIGETKEHHNADDTNDIFNTLTFNISQFDNHVEDGVVCINLKDRRSVV